jgi:hypothetical protein
LAGSIYNWSIELNLAHATISNRLRKAGIVFRKGQKISAKTMFAVMTGDLVQSKARLMAA